MRAGEESISRDKRGAICLENGAAEHGWSQLHGRQADH